jgi:hypothetical protein
MTTEIPETTELDDRFFERELPIRHFVFKAEPKNSANPDHNDMPNGTLIFSVEEVLTGKSAKGLHNAVSYAQEIAQKGLPPDLGRAEVTPFDIRVRQCWLILQLEKGGFGSNWQFSRKRLGCTAKHGDTGGPWDKPGFNVGLRHIRDNGKVVKHPKELGWKDEDDNCHMLLFGVVHRGPWDDDDQRNGSHYFNMNIEYRQIYKNTRSVLELIIDPDVGNEGPDKFP